jgi:hypothetical protein
MLRAYEKNDIHNAVESEEQRQGKNICVHKSHLKRGALHDSTSELECVLRAANAQLLERLQRAQSELANCHGKLTGSKGAKDWVWHSARVRLPKATDGDEAAGESMGA